MQLRIETVKNIIIKHIHKILLALLLIFHTVNNYLWLRADTLPPPWDQAHHLTRSLQYYELFTYPPASLLSEFINLSKLYPPYPPLVPILTGGFYYIFGHNSPDCAVMINILFMAILLGSVYGIGKKMHSKNVGLLAAFIVSTSPVVFALSRVYLLDFALIAMVSLNIYLLLLTDSFRSRKYSLLFGVTFGMGMLTKWTHVIYLAPSTIYVIYTSGALHTLAHSLKNAVRTIKSRSIYIVRSPVVMCALLIGLLGALCIVPNVNIFKPAHPLGAKLRFMMVWGIISFTALALTRTPTKGVNLANAMLVGILIAAIWYIPSMDILIPAVPYHTIGAGSLPYAHTAPFNPVGVFLYGLILMNYQISVLYFVFLAIAVVLLLNLHNRAWKRKSFLKNLLWKIIKLRNLSFNKCIILLWFTIPFIVFTFIICRYYRYTTPMIPAIAIIIAIGLLRIQNKKIKTILLIILLGGGLFQFGALSWGIARMPECVVIPLSTEGSGTYEHADGTVTPVGIVVFAQAYALNQHPACEDWRIEDILTFINENSSKGKSIVVGILADHRRFNACTFDYYVHLNEMHRIEIRSYAWSSTPVLPRILECDYVITKTGNIGPAFSTAEIRIALDSIEGDSIQFHSAFMKVYTSTLPDDSTATVYKKLE